MRTRYSARARKTAPGAGGLPDYFGVRGETAGGGFGTAAASSFSTASAKVVQVMIGGWLG